MTTTAEVGGATILSYSLELNKQDGNGWTTQFGEAVNSILRTFTLQPVVKGNTYLFRYRVKNLYGWSDYSPVLSSLVAIAPSQPPAPKFVSASDSQISLTMELSPDNGGDTITGYELY